MIQRDMYTFPNDMLMNHSDNSSNCCGLIIHPRHQIVKAHNSHFKLAHAVYNMKSATSRQEFGCNFRLREQKHCFCFYIHIYKGMLTLFSSISESVTMYTKPLEPNGVLNTTGYMKKEVQ